MAIERLTMAMRNAVKLSRSDARMMHVLDDVPVLGLTRYNVRTPQGNIVKLTVGENILDMNFLTKNEQGSYVCGSHSAIAGTSDGINKIFAKIIETIIKK